MRHDPDGPVVVLSPHLDDAVLSAWTAVAGPGAVEVVNVFAGLPPAGTITRWDQLAGATDSRELMRVRLAEDRAALALAGRAPTSLPLLDCQYRDDPASPGEVAAALDGRLPAAACRLRAPAGVGGHPDHLAVRDAGLALAHRAGVPVSLYAELPYALEPRWPHLGARVHRLGAGLASAKLRAMRRYRTQFPLLNRDPRRRLDQPRALGFEVAFAVPTISCASSSSPSLISR